MQAPERRAVELVRECARRCATARPSTAKAASTRRGPSSGSLARRSPAAAPAAAHSAAQPSRLTSLLGHASTLRGAPSRAAAGAGESRRKTADARVYSTRPGVASPHDRFARARVRRVAGDVRHAARAHPGAGQVGGRAGPARAAAAPRGTPADGPGSGDAAAARPGRVRRPCGRAGPPRPRGGGGAQRRGLRPDPAHAAPAGRGGGPRACSGRSAAWSVR